MDEKIDKAVEILLGIVRPNMKPDDALKVSQSVLNLAQARPTLVAGKK